MSTKKKMSKTAKAKKQSRRQFSNRHGVILIALLAVTILVVNLVAYSYSWFTPAEVAGKGLSMERTDKLRSENCTFETYQGEIVTADMYNHVAPYNTTEAINTYNGYYIDQIRYFNDPIADNDVITIPAATTETVNGKSVTTPGRVYFRTNIENQDTNCSSVVSLYHSKMPADISVAITYPSNTYHFVGTAEEMASYGGAADPNDVYDYAGYPDYFIIRNAYVKVRNDNDADGPGLLPVEWFVENNTATEKYIRVTARSHKTGSGEEETTVIDHVYLYLMYN